MFICAKIKLMKTTVKNPVIGIVGGRGTLGRIFRQAFESAGHQVLISGRKPDGKKILSNKALVKKADIIIVSVFLKDTIKVLREIAPLLKPNQLLADFTSLKSEPVKIMLTSKAEVIGLHPMFGQVESLIGHSIFACPARSKKLWPWLKKTLVNLGLNVHIISPKKHDELATVHQSIPHLLVIAFAKLLQEHNISPEKLFEISPPRTKILLLSAGRLLASDLEMYADIQLQNPSIKKFSAEFQKIFSDLSIIVTKGERTKLIKALKSSALHFGDWRNFAFDSATKLFQRVGDLKKKPLKQKVTPKKKIIKKASAKTTLAVLGPATQTEIAALEFMKKKKLKLSVSGYASNSEVFEAVVKGKAILGFVPLENYTVGPVRETMKKLFSSQGKVRIISEFSRPIAHALLGIKDLNENNVARIYAHPQAAAQSKKFLQKNFPKAEIVETTSAGKAITSAQKDPASLAIAPAESAKTTGLKIFHKNIEDDPNNRTRFIAIARQNVPCSMFHVPCRKTAIAFYFKKNKAGQLASALSIFAQGKINLSRIESIPTEKKLGEFFFFSECEVTNTSAKFKKAELELKKIATVVNLGSY